MSRFSDLAERTAKRFIMPEKPEPPSASEKLEDLVREWANEPACREIILPWLSVHIKRVELAEDSAITNHPLMLTLHGQVMALKQLRDILLKYSNPNLEP
jgi:hypothetical protein